MPNMTSDMQFEPEQLESYLMYLTIEQAMEDIAVFARDFSYPGLPSVDLTPGVVPWVFVGGHSSAISRTCVLYTDFTLQAVRIPAPELRGCVSETRKSSMLVLRRPQ